MLNPLSADHAALRTDLMPGLVAAAERNWNAHRRDVRLFEIGTAFLQGSADRPREERRVAGVISGAREPAHWTGSGKAPDADIWDLRGLFEAAVGLAHPEARVQVATDSRDGWLALGPDGSPVGWAAPVAADAPPWAAPLLGFELSVGSGSACGSVTMLREPRGWRAFSCSFTSLGCKRRNVSVTFSYGRLLMSTRPKL